MPEVSFIHFEYLSSILHCKYPRIGESWEMIEILFKTINPDNFVFLKEEPIPCYGLWCELKMFLILREHPGRL